MFTGKSKVDCSNHYHIYWFDWCRHLNDIWMMINKSFSTFKMWLIVIKKNHCFLWLHNLHVSLYVELWLKIDLPSHINIVMSYQHWNLVNKNFLLFFNLTDHKIYLICITILILKTAVFHIDCMHMKLHNFFQVWLHMKLQASFCLLLRKYDSIW